MASVLKPGWSKPSTILFASEIPANEKAFAFALAQASEFGADLILFHAYDTLVVAASETSGIRYYDYAAAARAEMKHLEPLAARARAAGLRCEIVVRPGLPADQILAYAQEREIDRIVMGTHSPGPIGKLLVGSVAEAVLRSAGIPVYIVGPEVVEGGSRNFATKTILCALSLLDTSHVVAAFAAELAAQHNAQLILQHVIKPQEAREVLAGRTIEDLEKRPARPDARGVPGKDLRSRPSWFPAIRPRNCSTRRAPNRPTWLFWAPRELRLLPPSPATAWSTRCWPTPNVRS